MAQIVDGSGFSPVSRKSEEDIESMPPSKRPKIDEPDTAPTMVASPSASAGGDGAKAPDLGPAMAGNQIEVLWHLGPEKVWWECAVSCPKLKKDRKERYIYQLDYIAKPDLDYGAETRTVVFTVDGLLRDIAGKTVMQYRPAGQSEEPEPLLSIKDRCIVQTEDDEDEWLAGVVDLVNNDGSYNCRVPGAGGKQLNIPRHRISHVAQPTCLPKAKTKKATDRFFEATVKHFWELDEIASIDPAVGKALKRSLRARQGEVDKLLAELTGEHEDLEVYEDIVAAINIAEFYSSKLVGLYGNAVTAAKEKVEANAAAAAEALELAEADAANATATALRLAEATAAAAAAATAAAAAPIATATAAAPIAIGVTATPPPGATSVVATAVVATTAPAAEGAVPAVAEAAAVLSA